MLSRKASNLYWLGRYIERADSTARLIEMGRRMAMLPGKFNTDEWRSVIQASGLSVEKDKSEILTESDAVKALLLSSDNPSSIRSCLSQARNNGRAIRTALTQEMWEALNDGWRTLENTNCKEVSADLSGILDWIKSRTARLRGSYQTGMLRDEGFDFLSLGSYLERADMMLRLLDVKYFVLLPETEVIGGGRDSYQWTSVLYANSAVRAYHHLYRGDHSPWKISDFLILNRKFPRSLAYSYGRIADHLEYLERNYGTRHDCHDTCQDIVNRLANIEMGEIFQTGLHEFIQDGLKKNTALSAQISKAYHF